MPGLGVVPVVATLLNYENVLTVLSTDRFHGGATFRFPAPIIDAWSLTNAQVGGGVNVDISLSPLLLIAVVAIEGVLAAGYLGSIDEGLDGLSFDFPANVARYGAPVLLYNALWYGVTALVMLPLAAVSPVLTLVVGFPVILVGMYLLYGTPYLLVANDTGLTTALGRSIEHGRRGGAYARYAIGFFGAVAGLSVFVTLVVMNVGALGLLAALVVAGTLGFALNVATMGFVRALEAGRFEDADSRTDGPSGREAIHTESSARSHTAAHGRDNDRPS